MKREGFLNVTKGCWRGCEFYSARSCRKMVAKTMMAKTAMLIHAVICPSVLANSEIVSMALL